MRFRSDITYAAETARFLFKPARNRSYGGDWAGWQARYLVGPFRMGTGYLAPSTCMCGRYRTYRSSDIALVFEADWIKCTYMP